MTMKRILPLLFLLLSAVNTTITITITTTAAAGGTGVDVNSWGYQR
jgi:hypothetical protein